MEKFAVSRLVGSPPGYVGYEEGGQLTEAVRRRPYSVILFDEIEKAHPDALQLLLQIMEDGRLTDSLGRTVDFRNAVIIMTSNVGAQLLQRQTSMGFAAAASSFNDVERMREKVQEEAKRVFKPEFLNRISDIIFFRPLDKADLVKIVSLETASFAKRLSARKITLEFTEAAKQLLIDKGYDEKYGARPLRRAVEHYLEDPLAEALLRGDIRDGEPCLVDRDGEKLVFSQRTPPTTATEVAS
jgi:ATP-dependent Clp protease ATP-binding subunit ClpC